MGRRKKPITQFTDKLSNLKDVYSFYLKGLDKNYPSLESDLNVRLEYITNQMHTWKFDTQSLFLEHLKILDEYSKSVESSMFFTLISSKLVSYIFSYIHSACYSKLNPRIEDIIPEELRHAHYDGQAVVSVRHTSPHYQTLLEDAAKKGKPIKKVKKINPALPTDFHCQHCQAPIDYLYLNAPNQVLCKCCKLTTSIERVKNNNQHIPQQRCPHCNNKLDLRKERSGFSVLRCSNYKCSFYLSNIDKANKVIKKHPELNLKLNQDFKLHYTFRHFNIIIELLKDPSIELKSVNSADKFDSITKSLNIFNEPIILLCLAYRCNYSISKNKIASILTELHDTPISSQTVDNYLDFMANLLRPFVENYPYQVSQRITADETYIKIEGKQYYLYRYFDYDTKIIISQYLSEKRDTIATYHSFNKCLTTIRDTVDLTDLTLVVDGYLPYQIVTNDLNSNYDGKFNIKVVPLIGLKNHCAENKPYVPDKQAIERDHRELKVAYHNSTNFRSVESALNYCTLQQAVHNFITVYRRAKLIPVKIKSYSPNDGVLDRWEKLILESFKYIKNQIKSA